MFDVISATVLLLFSNNLVLLIFLFVANGDYNPCELNFSSNIPPFRAAVNVRNPSDIFVQMPNGLKIIKVLSQKKFCAK